MGTGRISRSDQIQSIELIGHGLRLPLQPNSGVPKFANMRVVEVGNIRLQLGRGWGVGALPPSKYREGGDFL